MVILCLFLCSCQNNFTDASETIGYHRLSIPPGRYVNSVAWLNTNNLAFVYASGPVQALSDYQITVYNRQSDSLRKVQMPQSTECNAEWNLYVSRLPDKDLGFMHQCITYNEGRTSQESTLYKWIRQADTLRIVQRYPQGFDASYYSFAPTMKEWVQEQNGDRVKDELYYVEERGIAKEILPEYARLHSPSWSPDGSTVAFAGNSEVPEPRSNPFTALIGIRDVVNHPWNLFLIDADGNNLRKILADIVRADSVKWAPSGQLLSFSGVYQDTEGIWIVDTETNVVTRIWSHIALYDWSPDSEQILVVNTPKNIIDDESATDTSAYIIDVSTIHNK